MSNKSRKRSYGNPELTLEDDDDEPNKLPFLLTCIHSTVVHEYLCIQLANRINLFLRAKSLFALMTFFSSVICTVALAPPCVETGSRCMNPALYGVMIDQIYI